MQTGSTLKATSHRTRGQVGGAAGEERGQPDQREYFTHGEEHTNVDFGGAFSHGRRRARDPEKLVQLSQTGTRYGTRSPAFAAYI